MRLRPALVCAGIAGLVACGASLHAAYAAAKKPSNSGRPEHVYRLDYALVVTDEGKPPSITHATANAAEDESASVDVGVNMPLSRASEGGASPRMDVGLKTSTRVLAMGGKLLVHNHFSLSSPSGHEGAGVALRKVDADGSVLMAPSTPTVLTSIEDPTTHTRYELSVTATPLL